MDFGGNEKARKIAKSFCVRAFQIVQRKNLYSSPHAEQPQKEKISRFPCVCGVLTEDSGQLKKVGSTDNLPNRCGHYLDQGTVQDRIRVLVDLNLARQASASFISLMVVLFVRFR